MRLFLGIELPDKERRRINSIKERIKVNGRVKWVEKENLHITLLFIGEEEPDKVVSLLDGVEREVMPFNVRLSHISAFPSLSRPRVIWVGVGEGEEEIVKIHNVIYNRLKGLVKPEKRFIPHVTIGRVKYGRIFIRDIEYEGGETFPVDNFVLYSSNLTPDGPVYSVIKRFNFGGENW